MHVHGAQFDIAIRTPHRIQQLPARKDAARMLHEEFEQPEFGRPQREYAAAPRYLVRGGIQHQIAHNQRFPRQRRADAAHDGRNAGDQLARGKRLGQIIIRAGFQATDHVLLRPARGQHDDRHMRGGLVAAQAAADLDPAGALDHPVEHHQIGRVLAGQQQRLVAVGRAGDGIAFGVKAEFQQFGQRGIVFHQQEAGLFHRTKSFAL